MTQQFEKLPPRDRRITRHIRALAEAEGSIEKFAAAVSSVRDDPSLSSAHRDAIWRTMAQEAAQAYFVFATGKPIDLEALVAQMPQRT
jgi:hypothetical protein